MIEIIAYIMGGAMLGMMSMALVSANRFSRYNQRISELQHEVKTLKLGVIDKTKRDIV